MRVADTLRYDKKTTHAGSNPVLTTNLNKTKTMEQKFIIADNEDRVERLLRDGWQIVSVTAQHVAPGSSGSLPMRGHFAILLERAKPTL